MLQYTVGLSALLLADNSHGVGPVKNSLGLGESKGGGRPATLGGKFKQSMQDLYDMLTATSPHFIKCVKPNNVKKKLFDSNFTLCAFFVRTFYPKFGRMYQMVHG